MDSTKKHKVEIVPSSNGFTGMTHGIYADETRSLLENLLDQNVNIDHSCGGNGTCGTCHYFILQGQQNLSPVQEIEAEMHLDRGFSENERLACQSYVSGPIQIKIT